MAVGIICEYNPFHNGHLYHLNKVKEMYKDEEIILVLGGNFSQRGEASIIEKYDKAKIALEYGINLVVELPYTFATESADIFASGAISLLNTLKCDKVVFGSESGDIDFFRQLASVELNNKDYDKKVKDYLKEGQNYPTALSMALKDITGKLINLPNDILALSYVKEIIKTNSKLTPVTIKRTNDYKSKELSSEISSATSIREALKKGSDISSYVPKETLKYINNFSYQEKYFELLKYKIISEKENIKKYQTVDEGIENRIIKNIYNANSLEEFINLVKTKRYTYNKIERMFTHIICSFTKEEAKKNKKINYIRVLGFDKKGKEYLNKIKKDIELPLITNINKSNSSLISIELRCDAIYDIIMNKNDNLFAKKPIIK